MPLTVDVTMTPDKEAYNPGDIIEVSLHAYFNNEIKEEGKEYLLWCPYKNGWKVFYNKTINKVKRKVKILEVIESSISDTLIYFKNVNEEYNANFKIKILSNIEQVMLYTSAYGLGRKIYNGRQMGGYLKTSKGKIYYYESRSYKKQNKMRIFPPQKLPVLPKPSNYNEMRQNYN
jgi:hypothetical protein